VATNQAAYDTAWAQVTTGTYGGRPVQDVQITRDLTGLHMVISFSDGGAPPTIVLPFDDNVTSGTPGGPGE
jgi:hypothetical protein